MNKALFTAQAIIVAISTGVVGLEVVSTELATLIVFICGVVNAGITAWLATPAGRSMLSRD